MKCVACNSAGLVEGNLIDTSSGGSTAFKIKAISIWKRLLGVGTRSIRAYACVRCHHLQLAVNFTDEDLQRYLHFEGQQPDVLERINSEPGESKE